MSAAPIPLRQPIVLERSNPMATARAFVSQRYIRGRDLTLMHHFDEWRAWSGSHWPVRDEPSVRCELWQFMDDAVVLVKGQPQPFKPTAAKVSDALDALRAVCNVPRSCTPPCWIGRHQRNAPPTSELVACQNGILHLPTRKLRPCTPTLFNANANPFDFEPDAACPEWLQFLDELWPQKDQDDEEDPDDDNQAEDQWPGDALQEWFGHFLTTDTSQQKILLLHGPKRAGKGTIGRVITALLGIDNVCSPTLSSLGQNFGPWQLLDKQLGIIADARLSGRQDQHIIAERLLSISGEDPQTIDRKFKAPWTGRLGVRFLILTNELPRIADASAALPSRFIILPLTKSFLGSEDHGLTDRLLDELPGILSWALDGQQRLDQRGHFVQPKDGRVLVKELEDLSSPIAAFIRERCTVEPSAEVQISTLFDAWRAWCEAQGREHPGTAQSFGRDLRAAMPGLGTRQHPRRYLGIRLG